MNMVLKANSEFQKITSNQEKYDAQYFDSPEIRLQFKEYISKTFSNFPAFIEQFEDCNYEPSFLYYIITLSDDELVEEFGQDIKLL